MISMRKNIGSKVLAFVSIFGMAGFLLALPTAHADWNITRTYEVRNTNTADLTNTITITSRTGTNTTVGGAGGDGAAGGSADGVPAQDGGSTEVTAGDGGDGGAGGMGGIITTGDIDSEVMVDSEVNTSDVTVMIEDVDTDEDDVDLDETVTVENENEITQTNDATLDEDTGANTTVAADGGMGAIGGDATLTVSGGDDEGEGDTIVRGGRGGNGGAGGMGGDILTGGSSSRIEIISVVNRSVIRVER